LQNCEEQLQLCPVCPFVSVERLSSHWMDFHEIGIFKKSVKKIQV